MEPEESAQMDVFSSMSALAIIRVFAAAFLLAFVDKKSRPPSLPKTQNNVSWGDDHTAYIRRKKVPCILTTDKKIHTKSTTAVGLLIDGIKNTSKDIARRQGSSSRSYKKKRYQDARGGGEVSKTNLNFSDRWKALEGGMMPSRAVT